MQLESVTDILEARATARFDLAVGPVTYEAFFYYGRLRRLRQFVEQHYARPVSANQAATITGLKATYFRQFFRRHIGIGFQEWLSLFRICIALDRLSRSHLDLEPLAKELGFGSQRSFQRAMKRYTGHSPRVMRARLAPPSPNRTSSTEDPTPPELVGQP